ncbi:MAG TPA: HIT domain-containing protein [Candidatus Polarisedimenticolia bacterium]|nr:HIT domain-containing protein [Candidatus Polarisedimenticolia bacterium]
MRNLFTPWRYAYLAGGGRSRRCVFCKARDSRDDRSELVVHRGRYNFVILNRYPYNSGHLMIAPNEHLSSLARSSPAQLREMMMLAARCERALRRIYRMDGLNLGMNLGESAGAGILGHFHLHLVPRWKGDTNFMTVVGSTRVTPELLQDTFQKVRTQLRRPLKPGSKPARTLRRKAS